MVGQLVCMILQYSVCKSLSCRGGAFAKSWFRNEEAGSCSPWLVVCAQPGWRQIRDRWTEAVTFIFKATGYMLTCWLMLRNLDSNSAFLPWCLVRTWAEGLACSSLCPSTLGHQRMFSCIDKNIFEPLKAWTLWTLWTLSAHDRFDRFDEGQKLNHPELTAVTGPKWVEPGVWRSEIFCKRKSRARRNVAPLLQRWKATRYTKSAAFLRCFLMFCWFYYIVLLICTSSCVPLHSMLSKRQDVIVLLAVMKCNPTLLPRGLEIHYCSARKELKDPWLPKRSKWCLNIFSSWTCERLDALVLFAGYRFWVQPFLSQSQEVQLAPPLRLTTPLQTSHLFRKVCFCLCLLYDISMFLFGAHHWLDSTMKNMCTWYIL